jgi:hypothetical protein
VEKPSGTKPSPWDGVGWFKKKRAAAHAPVRDCVQPGLRLTSNPMPNEIEDEGHCLFDVPFGGVELGIRQLLRGATARAASRASRS